MGILKSPLKHLRMLTEKVAKNVYKVDSLCKYEAAVCKRAGLVGVKEFGNIKHDEMFTYFIIPLRLQLARQVRASRISSKVELRGTVI